MLPVKSFIELDRSSRKPVYLQIADALIREIKMGRIGPGERLPGTRKLADSLDVHRNTAVSAYDELLAQGWIETRPSNGTFVKSCIPNVSPRSLSPSDDRPVMPSKAGYSINPLPFGFQEHTQPLDGVLGLDDGSPDIRLAPVSALGKAYRRVMKRGLKLSYGDESGDWPTRKIFSDYVNKSRGLHTRPGNIIITRGSQMAMYLAIQTVIEAGDHIAIAEKSYFGAEQVFRWVGAEVHRVPLDAQGMDMKALQCLCQKMDLKAVYVIPHHQYPTTVSLSPERRIKLLNIASKNDLAIIEDDYDFDFHYNSNPILPLASTDPRGNVIYTGSFSKIIAPAFRVGFMIAPNNIIRKATKLRRIMDRQGDQILERALAELIDEGRMRRHLRKALNVYHRRRDHFCRLLNEKLGGHLQFTMPEGGMALWVTFTHPINSQQLSEQLQTEGLFLKDDMFYELDNGRYAMRVGFASLNENEMEQAVGIWSKVM